MYENMKPKDAAKVFEGLDTRILVEVAADIDPRRMGEIIAKMSTDAAQRLTIALMNKSVREEAAKCRGSTTDCRYARCRLISDRAGCAPDIPLIDPRPGA
jgi:Mg/Co/Ni transporter MgtE